MCTRNWQANSSSLLSPALSLPKTKATGRVERRGARRGRAHVEHLRRPLARARRQREGRRAIGDRLGERGMGARGGEHVGGMRRHPLVLRRGRALAAPPAAGRQVPWSSWRARPRRCCRDGSACTGRCGFPPCPQCTESRIRAAHAPDAQYRGQGGAPRRLDHQPRRARGRRARGEGQEQERLRHPGGQGRRAGDHRRDPRRLPRPQHPRRGVRRHARARAPSTCG